MPIKVDQMGSQDLSSQVVKMIVVLTELKNAYPRRISTKDMREALEYAGQMTQTNVGYTLRNAQRLLVQFEIAGLVEGDGASPQGWRLSAEGKNLLGLTGRA